MGQGDIAGGRRQATPTLQVLRQNYQEQSEALDSLLDFDETTESITDLKQWRRQAKKSVSQLATTCKALGKSLVKHGISSEASEKCMEFNTAKSHYDLKFILVSKALEEAGEELSVLDDLSVNNSVWEWLNKNPVGPANPVSEHGSNDSQGIPNTQVITSSHSITVVTTIPL